MNQPTQTLNQKVKAYERGLIEAELPNHSRLDDAAIALGIPYKTLWRRMRSHGISR